MIRLTTIAMLVAFLTLGGRNAAAQDCYGPGDIHGDGIVDAADLAAMAPVLFGPDVPIPGADPEAQRADLDTDGDVDARDYARLMSLVGKTYFLYGPHRDNLEAEMLAMEVSGQLRAPELHYVRILADLASIRQAFPELALVIDDPDYAPNQLIIGAGACSDGGIDQLNEYYRVVDQDIHPTWRVLTFCDNLNARVLAGIYAASSEVSWAEPNYLVGIDDYITVEVLGKVYRYDIDDGFLDCFDGCDCHREWLIDVDITGEVTLVSYQEWGQSWCEF